MSRFIEFLTESSDNGELNCGFKDMSDDKWYYTKDSENAKDIVDLLNDLYDENQTFKLNVVEWIDEKLLELDSNDEVSLIPRESVVVLEELRSHLCGLKKQNKKY